MEASFYQLTTSSLEKALPKLIEKIYSSGHRIEVVLENQERLEAMNNFLWTFSQGAFIPHGHSGMLKKEEKPEDYPVWLTLEAGGENKANVLIMTAGFLPSSLPQYERYIDIFDGNDENACKAAIKRIDECQKQGYAVTHWKQSLDAKWQKEN